MASPCVEDGCGIHLSVTNDVLKAAAVIAPLPCNAVQCIPGQGLFVGKDESVVAPGTVPFGGGGWSVDLNAIPVGIAHEVSSPPYSAVGPQPTITIPNESACFAENLISIVTSREVRYDGPAGAHFQVVVQGDFLGAGYVDLFNIVSDYRFASTAPGGLVSDARAGGAGAAGTVIAPAANYTFRYRILLTNLIAVAAGSIVSSPGLSFAHLAVTN